MFESIAVQFVQRNAILFSQKDVLHNLPAFSEKYIEYSVEVSMPDYFEIPCKIYIPVNASARVNAKHLENGNCCFATEKGNNCLILNTK